MDRLRFRAAVCAAVALLSTFACDRPANAPPHSRVARGLAAVGAVSLSLKTNDGLHFVVAEDGGGVEGEFVGVPGVRRPSGLARADRTAAGAWETFEIVFNDQGEVGFRASNGAALSAQPDGTLVFNRARPPDWTPEAWEAFKIEPGRDGGAGGGVSFVTVWGTRVRAPDQGGGELRHDPRDGPGIDETFFPSAPLRGPPLQGGDTSTSGIRGQLRVEPGGGFLDDAGPVLPVFCHFGDAFSRWTRGQQAEVTETLRHIKAAGFDGIRFWTTLGPGDPGRDFWAGRHVTPVLTPNYWAQLEAFLVTLRDLGLVAQISQGDTRPIAIPDRRVFFELLADTINRVGPSVAAVVEFGNESWQTGESDPRAAARALEIFRRRCPAPLLILSSPAEESAAAINAWSIAPASLWNFHDYRDGRWWDKVRHVWSLVYADGGRGPNLRVGWSGEPPGFGKLVSAIRGMEELDAAWAQLYVAELLIARRGAVWFSGPGVISDHPNGERLETMPGFWEAPQVKTWLPADVMRYDGLYHGGARFADRAAFLVSEAETRADHAWYRDGRQCAVIYGPNPPSVRQNGRFRNVTITHDHSNPKGRVVCGSFH